MLVPKVLASPNSMGRTWHCPPAGNMVEGRPLSVDYIPGSVLSSGVQQRREIKLLPSEDFQTCRELDI